MNAMAAADVWSTGSPLISDNQHAISMQSEVWSTGSPLISDNHHAIIMQSSCNQHAIRMQSAPAHLVDGQPTERECEEIKPAVH
jgi:hypothetical protein